MSGDPAKAREAAPFRSTASETLPRHLLDGAPIGMALVGADSHLSYASPAFDRMLGLEPGGAVGQGIASFTREEDRQALLLRIDQVLRGETDKFAFDCCFVRADTGPFWVMVIGALLADDDPDAMPSCILQLIDIDQRKSAEDALRRSEDRLQFALEAAGQGVWDYDARRDEIFHSPSWRTMRGYAADEYVDPARKKWFERIHPDDLERVRSTVDRQEHGDAGFDRMEYRERHRDGHYIWILSRGRPVERDEQGNRTRAVGTDTDITFLKAIETQLSDEKERFRTTLEAIADGVISTDAQGQIMFMNPSAEAMTGWLEPDAAGRVLSEVFVAKSESTGEPAANPVALSLATGEPSQIEADVVLVSRDGTGREVGGTASPVRAEDGRLIGAVLVFKDVTSTQELQRKLAHSANYDALTGLLNRASFARSLAEARREVTEDGRTHALCYIDLDYFKPVNDKAGHAAGDALLQSVARVIRRNCRSHDIAARIGGDEFVLLLSDCALKNASEVAQKVVGAIADLAFSWSGVHHRIGASAGVAPITADPQRDPLIEADGACYAAKAAGRGQVKVNSA
jgi:diguanylate cyclase (GGDEF)-like protein/PAS domain S-box-containing protein